MLKIVKNCLKLLKVRDERWNDEWVQMRWELEWDENLNERKWIEMVMKIETNMTGKVIIGKVKWEYGRWNENMIWNEHINTDKILNKILI